MTDDRYETISIESKIREGVFHKVVKDLESGKAVSCSCGCWSKGNKPCAAMRTIGYESDQKMKVCRWCKEEVPDDTDGACPNCKSTEGYMR